MKQAILFLLTATFSFTVQAFTVTTQGSDELSWLTNGNACWRACFSARNKAIANMGRIAAGHCPRGYSVTKAAACDGPAKDNSFLDHRSGWPVCKCTETCTGDFVCNTTGQKPSFHVNAVEEWRKLRRAWRINAYDIQRSQEQMASITKPKQLYLAVAQQSRKLQINAKPFMAAYHEGLVQEVQAPSVEQLMSEFMVELPIVKSTLKAKKAGPHKVVLQGLMGPKQNTIYVFSKGKLLKAVETQGLGHIRTVISDSCLHDSEEIEVVINGESQSLVVQ